MSGPHSINVVGAGQLGRVLARAWRPTPAYRIAALYSRRLVHALEAQAFVGEGEALDDLAALPPADVWLISTPDSAIEPTLRALCALGKIQRQDLVLHASGSQDSRLLSAAQSLGAATASVHPAMSFADAERALAHLQQAPLCALEGSSELACDRARELMQAIGLRCFAVASGEKSLYHAACVLANNYAVALLASAQALLEQAGVEAEVHSELLRPLMQQALDGVSQKGAVASLSGPIARGDAEAVLAQQRAVAKADPDLGRLYAVLGLQAVSLARQAGADKEALARLEDQWRECS